MKKIGITGTVGSGKTQVCDILKKKGYPVFHADELAKQASAALKENIVEILGADIINADGQIDSAQVSEKVFNAPEKLKALNNVIHPQVKKLRSQLFRQIAEQTSKPAFYESALIFEANIQDEFDAIIVVSTPKEIRHQRLIEQRGYSIEEIKRRESAQLSDEEKQKRADYVLLNESTIRELSENLSVIVHNINVS